MTKRKFWIIYTVLAVCQMVICNYFNFTPLVSLSILPAMVVCIPLRVSTPWTMLIAFLTGLLVDLGAGNILGLSAFALVPVALCRAGTLRMFLGHDIVERPQNLSFKAKGFAKISGVCIVSVSIFFILYVIADSAGTRPFLFNLTHFLASALVSWAVSLAVVAALSPNETP